MFAKIERSRLVLAADGCVITAGAFGLLTAFGFGLSAATGVDQDVASLSGVAAAVGWMAWLSTVIGIFVGPFVAWRLHRRGVSRMTVLGAVMGLIFGGAAVYALALVAALVGYPINLIARSEFAGPIAILVIYSLGFLAVVAWVDTDAVRDLAASRREHVALDVTRLVATLAIIGFAAGVALLGGGDPEAGVFMLAAGVSGAVTVFVTDEVLRRDARQKAAAGGPTPSA